MYSDVRMCVLYAVDPVFEPRLSVNRSMITNAQVDRYNRAALHKLSVFVCLSASLSLSVSLCVSVVCRSHNYYVGNFNEQTL